MHNASYYFSVVLFLDVTRHLHSRFVSIELGVPIYIREKNNIIKILRGYLEVGDLRQTDSYVASEVILSQHYMIL